MKLSCILSTLLILTTTLLFLFSCGDEDTPEPTPSPDDSEIGVLPDSDKTPPDSEKAEEDYENAENENPPVKQTIIFAEAGMSNDCCYIVYGNSEHYETALSVRASITNSVGVTLIANSYIYIPYLEENSTGIPELIIGETNRSSANLAICAFIDEIEDPRDYFFFIQSENNLIFYASSEEGYARGADIFPDIFLKDGIFSCIEDFSYIEFIPDEQ